MSEIFALWSAGAPADPSTTPTTSPETALHADEAGVEVLIAGDLRLAGTTAGGDRSPARQLLAAYRDLGDGVLGTLRGEFAFALLDRPRRRALLAVDRMGTHALCHGLNRNGQLVIGSSARAVARAIGTPVALDPQALYDYMYLHMVPSPATVYPGVYKLPPASRLVHADGQLDVRRYWQPAFPGDGPVDAAALRSELHERLRAAVAACRPDDLPSGAFLSGGLDSSTVVGVLAGQAGTPVQTFSVGFNTEGYDELEYARLAARRFGASAHEYIVTPDDVAAALPLIAAAYDEPFGNSSAVPTWFCARMAREAGVQRLIAGDGGDEIFAGNPHYTRQMLFEHYWRLPATLRQGLLEKHLPRVIPETAPWPLGKLRSYVEQARIPLPRRLHSWNFMFRHSPEEIFDPAFLARIDTDHPVAVMDATWAEVDGAPVLDKLLYFDWKFVLADNDLRKVGQMCRMAGVEVRYPMLDDGLVDFSLRIPARLKIRGQQLRHFYKEAMQGFLPDEILHKSKHGFGLPFGVWLKTSPVLRALVDETFTALARRNIFRGDFLEKIRTLHREGHPSYHGYVIWDLLMLEHWLAAHGGQA